MIDRQGRVERGILAGPEARASEPSDFPVEDRMRVYGVPGMSVAIIDGGEVDWAAGYGLAGGDELRGVSPSTLFQCCSISKMVASLMTLSLVGRGLLDLDADVNCYLPMWKLRTPAGGEVPVTLRQLLSHTGGVNIHGAPGYPRGVPAPTLLEVLDGKAPAITAAVRVTSEPGRTYRYSGGGYCVLQLLIETITGLAFAEAATEFVLKPLGMLSSTFAQPLPESLWPHAAAAHVTLSNLPTAERWFVYPEQAVGGLWTTALDLAQVVLELQRAMVGDGRVLTQQLANEMLTLHSDNWNVGLGTYISNADDPASRFFSHTGAHLGWHAVLMGYESGGKGAIVLTNNGYTGSELYREFLFSVARVYDWPKFTGSFR